MPKRDPSKTALYTITAVLVLVGVGLTCLAMQGFTYYDNGRWVQSNLLVVYARSLMGYGSKAINDRRLPRNWGSSLGYAARNFTLDLTGLDYSRPLAWEDIASGSGLVVMQVSGVDRTSVALFPTPGITVKPGEKVVANIRLVHENFGTPMEDKPLDSGVYTITLYRPKFSSVAYVIKVEKDGQGK